MAGFGPPRTSQRRPGRGLGSKASTRLLLPRAGRGKPAPEFPLSDASDAVVDTWERLWGMPQAVGWEHDGCERLVARYCRKLLLAEQDDAPTSLLGEVRQLEDRLGLSPQSMLRLGWEITDVALVSDSEDDLADVHELYG